MVTSYEFTFKQTMHSSLYCSSVFIPTLNANSCSRPNSLRSFVPFIILLLMPCPTANARDRFAIYPLTAIATQWSYAHVRLFSLLGFKPQKIPYRWADSYPSRVYFKFNDSHSVSYRFIRKYFLSCIEVL